MFGRRGGGNAGFAGRGCGFGFRGSSPGWPYIGRGRGGLPRCGYYGAAPVYPTAYTGQVSGEDELAYLKNQAAAIKSELEQINSRMEQINPDKTKES